MIISNKSNKKLSNIDSIIIIIQQK